jgi:hypothetical protein
MQLLTVIAINNRMQQTMPSSPLLASPSWKLLLHPYFTHTSSTSCSSNTSLVWCTSNISSPKTGHTKNPLYQCRSCILSFALMFLVTDQNLSNISFLSITAVITDCCRSFCSILKAQVSSMYTPNLLDDNNLLSIITVDRSQNSTL